MDPLSMIVVVGIAVVSGAIGYIGGRRRRKSHASPLVTCDGCEHSLSFRDDDRACRAETVRTRYNSRGVKTGKVWVRCNCQQYIGPVPVERMLANFTLPSNAVDQPAANDDQEEGS